MKSKISCKQKLRTLNKIKLIPSKLAKCICAGYKAGAPMKIKEENDMKTMTH